MIAHGLCYNVRVMDRPSRARADDRWLFGGAASVLLGTFGGGLCAFALSIEMFANFVESLAGERSAIVASGIAGSPTTALVGGGALTILGVLLLGYWVYRVRSARASRGSIDLPGGPPRRE